MSSTTPGSDAAGGADESRETSSSPAAAEEHERPEVPAAEAEAPAADAAADPAPATPAAEPEPDPAPWPDETPEAAVEPEPEPEPAPAPPADTDRAEAPAPSALDEAVARANAGAEPRGDDEGIDEAGSAETTPQPVAAGAVRRETYVPPSTPAVAGAAAGAATLAPDPFAATPQTVYVQAPEPPRTKGNRGFGVLVALIGTALFALLYAGIAYLLLLSQGDPAEVGGVFAERFLAQAVYWVPIAAFFAGFALLAAIINRGRWWAYVVFGLLVGVLVYFSYLGGALITVQAWTLTFDEAQAFIAQRWLDPFAIVAAVIAREIPIWLGGWIAARGRTVTERNIAAREAYDRELAAGPQPIR